MPCEFREFRLTAAGRRARDRTIYAETTRKAGGPLDAGLRILAMKTSSVARCDAYEPKRSSTQDATELTSPSTLRACDEIEGFLTAETWSSVRCSTRGITAGHQRYLNAAEALILIEDRAARVAVTGSLFTLRDVHRKPKHVIDGVMRVVRQTVSDIANEKR